MGMRGVFTDSKLISKLDPRKPGAQPAAKARKAPTRNAGGYADSPKKVICLQEFNITTWTFRGQIIFRDP